MADTISIDTGVLMASAEQIDAARAQMLQVAQEGQNLANQAASHWQGQAASQFGATFSNVYNKLQAADAVLSGYSKFLMNTVERYETTEAQRQSDNLSFEGGN